MNQMSGVKINRMGGMRVKDKLAQFGIINTVREPVSVSYLTLHRTEIPYTGRLATDRADVQPVVASTGRGGSGCRSR